MAVRTWQGGSGADWNTNSNWSGNAVPTGADSVVISGSHAPGNGPDSYIEFGGYTYTCTDTSNPPSADISFGQTIGISDGATMQLNTLGSTIINNFTFACQRTYNNITATFNGGCQITTTTTLQEFTSSTIVFNDTSQMNFNSYSQQNAFLLDSGSATFNNNSSNNGILGINNGGQGGWNGITPSSTSAPITFDNSATSNSNPYSTGTFNFNGNSRTLSDNFSGGSVVNYTQTSTGVVVGSVATGCTINIYSLPAGTASDGNTYTGLIKTNGSSYSVSDTNVDWSDSTVNLHCNVAIDCSNSSGAGYVYSTGTTINYNGYKLTLVTSSGNDLILPTQVYAMIF